MGAIQKAVSKTLAVADDYGDLAGGGFDGSSDKDTSVPFIRLIQSMSPELKKDTKLEGAEEGMFVNSVTRELISGDEGFIFQPCAVQHTFMEWKPKDKGGGLVAIHAIDSEVVKTCQETQEFAKYKTPAGNDLVETYNVACLVHVSSDLGEQVNAGPQPVILSFKSTAIKPYRAYFTRVYMVKGKIPLFAHRVHITSVPDKNGKGDFVNWKLTPLVNNDILKSLIPARLGDAQHPLLAAGKQLSDAYLGGELEVKHENAKPESGGPGDEKPPF